MTTTNKTFPALFAVKPGKGFVERPLGVFLRGEQWQVFYDGVAITEPAETFTAALDKTTERFFVFAGDSEDFRDQSVGIFGRIIEKPEYMRLVKARAADKAAGIELNRPLDLLQSKISI